MLCMARVVKLISVLRLLSSFLGSYTPLPSPPIRRPLLPYSHINPPTSTSKCCNNACIATPEFVLIILHFQIGAGVVLVWR
jgi:hypothetical protein